MNLTVPMTWLRMERLLQRYNQENLALRAGMSQNFLSKLELGRYKANEVEKELARLARVLRWTKAPEDLLKELPQEER
jgi:transcriptional regulator with XRE-family HTH domain